jgi:hypothetical protein
MSIMSTPGGLDLDDHAVVRSVVAPTSCSVASSSAWRPRGSPRGAGGRQLDDDVALVCFVGARLCGRAQV